MRHAALFAMFIAATLLFFGATLQAGLGMGPLHEPQIIPVAIAETICGVALLTAAMVLGSSRGWRAALVANAIALAEVVLEIVMRMTLAGPQTIHNHARLFFPEGYVYTFADDRFHQSLLVLTTISLLILSIKRSSLLTNKEEYGRKGVAAS